MKRRLRLRGRRDFQALVTGRRAFAAAGFIGFARPAATAGTRVGVAVSRQIRGSVDRNRARRRLREAGRLGLVKEIGDWAGAEQGITFDVVLIARPAALVLPFSELLAQARRFGRALVTTGR